MCLLLSFLLVLSCQSKEGNTTSSETIEKWKLVKITETGLMPEREISSLPYEEIYEFKSDSTFRRYRSNGYEATGTYSVQHYGQDDYGFIAKFDDTESSYHELPPYGKLYSYTKGQVYLKQSKLDELIESYIASDGPSFYYLKVKDKDKE